MSTSYRPLVDLNYKDLKKKCTDIEFVKHENSSNKWGEILHKDGNWLHFYEFKNKVCGFTRYGGNYVDSIINHIEQVMSVPIYDEYFILTPRLRGSGRSTGTVDGILDTTFVLNDFIDKTVSKGEPAASSTNIVGKDAPTSASEPCGELIKGFTLP